MDGTVSTRLSGFSSDADWSAAAQGRRVNNERLHVTRGRGGEPRQKNLPPGGGVLRDYPLPPPFNDTDRPRALIAWPPRDEGAARPPATPPILEARPASALNLRLIGNSPLPPRQIGGKAQDGETPRMARIGLGAAARQGECQGLLTGSRGDPWGSTGRVDEVLDRIWFGQ